MEFKILKQKIDLEFTPVYGDLRRQMLEIYESYLESNEDDDEICKEIRKDINEGGSLTLNAYAAQEFIDRIMDLESKRSALYKYAKRFLVDTGIYKEIDPENPAYIFTCSSGSMRKEEPVFVLDGKGYVFNKWLKREDHENGK